MIREICLEEIPRLADRLSEKIESSGFKPDVVVFLERAGRLLALSYARATGVPVVGLHVRRPKTGLKRLLVPVLRRMPKSVLDRLRRLEAERTFVRRGPRQVEFRGPPVDLSGLRVLVLDDAADSGSSVLAALQWIVDHSGDASSVRVGVVAATANLGREVVDYSLFHENCRFPWSSDSTEHGRFVKLHRDTDGEVEQRWWRP